MKNCKSHERHLAVCANIEKDVESFTAEGRATSIVMSFIEKWNAIKRDVDGDSVERSFSVSIDNVWLNIFTEISGATHEVHLKQGYSYG